MLTDLAQTGCLAERGFFESVFSIPNVLGRAASATKTAKEKMDIAMFNHLYNRNDAVIKDIVLELLKTLAMVIANINIVLDVPAVIIGGRVKDLDIDLEHEVKKRLQETIPFPPDVQLSSLDAGAIKGALYFGVESVLKNVVDNGALEAAV